MTEPNYRRILEEGIQAEGRLQRETGIDVRQLDIKSIPRIIEDLMKVEQMQLACVGRYSKKLEVLP